MHFGHEIIVIYALIWILEPFSQTFALTYAYSDFVLLIFCSLKHCIDDLRTFFLLNSGFS